MIHAPDVVASDDLDILNAGSENTVFKFQEQPTGGDDIGTDGSATVGAAIDGHLLGRRILSFEPSSADGKIAIAKVPQRVDGIPGGDDDPVAEAQVTPADHLVVQTVAQDSREGSRPDGPGHR